MPQIEVTLPSGAKGRIRGLKGSEINLFANKSNAKRNKTAMQILQNVWLETLEPGPLYSGDKIDWTLAPQCDRFTALFHARIATYSEEYEFRHKCTACGKAYTWAEDLSLRPVKMMSEEAVHKFLDGNKFSTEVVTPEGDIRRVVFQLLTPKLEDKIEMAQGMAPKEKATVSLAQRIVSIEGLEDGKGPLKRFLENLDAGAMFDLIDAMDEPDGGIETECEVTCPHCGWEENVELPLGEEFWRPSQRKRSTKSSMM